MQSIGSVMTFLMNQILIAFSSTAVAVFGVYFKLQSFVFMPVFGLNNGTVPIVAYNFGARKGDRMKEDHSIRHLRGGGHHDRGHAAVPVHPGQAAASV